MIVEVELQETLDILTMVYDLKSKGLVIGVDFEFEFSQSLVDSRTYLTTRDKHVKFTFHDDEWATWFILKWM